MKRVVTAAVLIPLVVLFIFRSPFWLQPIVFAIVAVITLSEYLAIVEAHGIRTQRWLVIATLLAAFLSPLLPWQSQDSAVLGPIVPLFLAPFAFLLASLRSEELRTCLPTVAASTLGIYYVGLGLFSLSLVLNQEHGGLLALYVLIVVWVGDIAAYYAGRTLGRRLLAPVISPKKTWEGTFASLVVSVTLGTLFLTNLEGVHSALLRLHLADPIPGSAGTGFFGPGPLPKYPIWFAVIGSLVINVAAQLGDLVESAFKRGANIKDSGSILPGHGGLLDRIDALLLAGPAAMLVFGAGRILFPPSLYP